jgi:hypothetical protein
MNNWYICLEPGTDKVVDKFIGTEEDVSLRSRTLEIVRLEPGLHPNFINVFRDSGTVIVKKNEIKVQQAEIEERRHDLYSMKLKRDRLLSKSDWVVSVSDLPLSPEKVEEWKVYRQALRDLPANTIDLEHIIWPTPPM